MRWGLVLVLVVVAIVIAMRCRSDQSTRVAAPTIAAEGRVPKPAAAVVRGAITGVVIDEARAPIAGAFVCADSETEHLCTTTDQTGAFRFEMRASRVSASASAATYRPRVEDVKRDVPAELVLRKGGVEITGTVVDVNGGPIAGARVIAKEGSTESRPDGTFSLWVAPGNMHVRATAEGYASASRNLDPPAHIVFELIPEGTLSGVVVDAVSGAPVPDVLISLETFDDGRAMELGRFETDEQGVFRATRLHAGRYGVIAMADHGYGHSDGSFLVGVGTDVTGVVVKLHAAARVEAKVIVSATKQACPGAWIKLDDRDKARGGRMVERDGVLRAVSVLPGSYTVTVGCRGFIARDDYPRIVVGSNDVSAIFEVEPGATIEGTVRTASGLPVRQTGVSIATIAYGRTDEAGQYKLEGLRPGTYTVGIRDESLPVAKSNTEHSVTIVGHEVVRRDFVVSDSGALVGKVVDGEGRPLDKIQVSLDLGEERPLDMFRQTDANGTFRFDRVPVATELQVVAWHPFHLQGGEVRQPVVMAPGKTSSLTLVLERDTGSIRGIVVDDAGNGLSDISIVIASDERAGDGVAWDYRDADALTASDGTFTLNDLPVGQRFTIRARRKGGAQGIVEHVAIGSTPRIVLPATGSITGVVRTWNSSLEELSISVSDDRTRALRTESFFRTAGAFTIKDLMPGTYTLTAGAEGRETSTQVTLAPGEHRTGVVIELVSLVAVTARVVDSRSGKPIEGVWIWVRPMKGWTPFSLPDVHTEQKTDANGRITVRGVPVGSVVVNLRTREDEDTYWVRTVTGSGTVDVGDLPLIRSRVAPNERWGDPGLVFADLGARIEDFELRVESVTPNGPAANAGIKAGDVITHVDGLELRGWTASNIYRFFAAPPGTKLTIKLARGITVELVLARQP